MSAPGEAAQAADEREDLRRTADRVTTLLGELRAASSPATWARIEELVSSLTATYGAAFERLVVLVAPLVAPGAAGDAARAALVDDPLVASLLVLHGLHPVPVAERVARALGRVRRAAGDLIDAGVREEFDAAGRLVVRVTGDWRARGASAGEVEGAIRSALEDAAPDVGEVTVVTEGVFATKGNGLVQIDLSRPRRTVEREAAG